MEDICFRRFSIFSCSFFPAFDSVTQFAKFTTPMIELSAALADPVRTARRATLEKNNLFMISPYVL
jgi:hypothetical protein